VDKIKKYLKDHEEHLSVDRISDKVWANVYNEINTKPSFIGKASRNNYILRLKNRLMPQTASRASNRSSDRIFRSPSYTIKWAFALLLPLLLVFSCTYRVDRVEAIGSLISFDVIKENIDAIREINLLQKKHRFSSIRFDKQDKIHDSFISFIDKEEEKHDKIVKEIKQLTFISSVSVVPVEAKITESLFSTAVHKVFKIHVDGRKPERKEVQRLVEHRLNKLGFTGVYATMVGGKIQLGIDKGLMSPVLVQPDPVQTIAVQPDTFPAVNKVPEPFAKADTLVVLAPNMDTATAPVVKNEKAMEKTSPITGQWNGKLIGDTLTMKFDEPKPTAFKSNASVSTQKFSMRDIGISTLVANVKKQGNVYFDIKREAGIANCKVIVLNTNYYDYVMVQDAVGTYVFEGDFSFRTFLNQNGFENVSTNLLYLLFITNTNKQDVLNIKAKGFTTSPKLEEYLSSKL
jgi:hypothetical protein